MTKYMKEMLDIALAAGFVLLEVQPSRGTHAKLRMRYKDETFFLLCSASRSSDRNATRNFATIVNGIKRAIDTGDHALRRKYLPRKSDD